MLLKAWYNEAILIPPTSHVTQVECDMVNILWHYQLSLKGVSG